MSTKKLTQIDFIERCKSIHGEKYDYSGATYINSITKINVKCNICNFQWKVSPANHIGGNMSGCPECKRRTSVERNKAKFNTNWFIQVSSKKHKDRFDYSETTYIDNNHKIDIICHQHGKFNQWPSDHMRGIGCALCSGSIVEHDTFIEKMKLKHPKFDFSRYRYNTAKSKSIVICPVHGEFLQHPNALNNAAPNHGCNQCGTKVMLSTKIEKGDIRSADQMSEYEAYRKAVWRITNQQYKLHKDIINPSGLPRSLRYHLDHIFSIQQGWMNKISAEIIGGYRNLQILEGKRNRQKGNKCEITLEEILPFISFP